MANYEERGREIGALVDRKNRAYGASFAKSGEFLRLLYPHGMKPEQYADALLLARIFDKQMRVATDADAFGESPFADVAGYGLLGAEQHRERVSEECGSAKGDVGAPSKETPSDSAERAASVWTTLNVNDRSGASSTTPSSSPSEPTSASTDAPAPTATEDALQDLVARGRSRNSNGFCAQLEPNGFVRPISLVKSWVVGSERLRFCSLRCAERFYEEME